MSPFDSSSRRVRPRWAASSVLAGLATAAMVLVPACKKNEKDTCNPDEKGFTKVRVVVQPMPDINPDPAGTPRPTSLRIFQIKGGRSLDVPLDFRQVWKDAASAFGDELLKDEELTIYPDKADVFEIEPIPEATHFVAAAIFHQPLGNSWYAEWEAPLYHGDSVCLAEQKKPPQTYEDPCFLIFMEGNQIDGGHKPPPGMEMDAFEIVCPPEPLKVKPAPAEMDPKQKKKEERKKKREARRAKLKGKAEDTQEAGEDAQGKADAAEGAGDKASSAGDKVSNPEAPKGPDLPGKD